MLAFRSEEHVDRWCRSLRIPRGASFSLEQAWQLGRAWYSDKLSPDWRRATPDEAEAIFASIGLTGDFWRLRS
jgi:alkylmercury lyase-like protein